jgi:hypothetical protein
VEENVNETDQKTKSVQDLSEEALVVKVCINYFFCQHSVNCCRHLAFLTWISSMIKIIIHFINSVQLFWFRLHREREFGFTFGGLVSIVLDT